MLRKANQKKNDASLTPAVTIKIGSFQGGREVALFCHHPGDNAAGIFAIVNIVEGDRAGADHLLDKGLGGFSFELFCLAARAKLCLSIQGLANTKHWTPRLKPLADDP